MRRFKLTNSTRRLATEQAAIASSRRLQPWIDDYLPRSPFQTVVLVVVLLMIGTAFKHVFQLTNTYLVALVAARIGRQIRQTYFRQSAGLGPGRILGIREQRRGCLYLPRHGNAH